MESEADKLAAELNGALERLNIRGLAQKAQTLERASAKPDFWQNSAAAQTHMQELSRLQHRIEPWLNLEKTVTDLRELSLLNDAKLEPELKSGLATTREDLDRLQKQLRFDGPYDDHGAIVSLFAGAGGTDAQDWTQILFRMYVRFFERNHWKYRVIDESPGEEAGLKSIVVEVDGDDFTYGRLRGEQGVHRLVRLSPFNADHLRQTSFSKVEIAPKIDSPSEAELDTKDLKIDVFRSGGHGGQSVNTTDSAVRVTHLPTGITVAIQNERSQLQNRETALTLLRSRLIQLQLDQHAQALNELKGPNQSAEWGNQIRSYVLHPYKQVKDLRTKYETSDVEGVLNGKLEPLIEAYLASAPAV